MIMTIDEIEMNRHTRRKLVPGNAIHESIISVNPNINQGYK